MSNHSAPYEWSELVVLNDALFSASGVQRGLVRHARCVMRLRYLAGFGVRRGARVVRAPLAKKLDEVGLFGLRECP